MNQIVYVRGRLFVKGDVNSNADYMVEKGKYIFYTSQRAGDIIEILSYRDGRLIKRLTCHLSASIPANQPVEIKGEEEYFVLEAFT